MLFKIYISTVKYDDLESNEDFFRPDDSEFAPSPCPNISMVHLVAIQVQAETMY